MCLSQEPDGRASDRETPREEGRGKARDRGRKWEQSKETGEGDVESGEAPATVFQSMMMNYFDRDNQDEMLMRVCQRMQSQPD